MRRKATTGCLSAFAMRCTNRAGSARLVFSCHFQINRYNSCSKFVTSAERCKTNTPWRWPRPCSAQLRGGGGASMRRDSTTLTRRTSRMLAHGDSTQAPTTTTATVPLDLSSPRDRACLQLGPFYISHGMSKASPAGCRINRDYARHPQSRQAPSSGGRKIVVLALGAREEWRSICA